ncbi:Dual-action HEIGH metallo-peptidase [Dyadobacter soli]|uniref:Dual-action HEIGH metallo-peptidase n=1 Tax=Dyadobacter soli TaxID=659014 RepID=A0A1G6VMG5_9BACT|nr:M57 family metalloprotease [Dyadobacter soli]SDD54734.1 Dual-action HEIGH metallo-peptidase [Dyadobacter soli]
MKKIILLTILSTLFLYACQQDEVPVNAPVLKEINDSARVESLKDFLASTTGAAKAKISYSEADSLFIIDGDVVMPRVEAEKYYQEDRGASSTHRRGLYLVDDIYARNIRVFMQPDVPLEWVTAIREAIRQWNLMWGTKINFVEVSDYNSANISIRTTFEPNSDYIARAQFPYTDRRPGNPIVINTRYNTLPAKTKLTAIAHEMGHTIGLMHTDQVTPGQSEKPVPGTPLSDPLSVMNSVVQTWTGFTGGDVKAVQAMYPDGEWMLVPGSATDIAVGRQAIYAIGQDAAYAGYNVYRMTGWGTWTRTPGTAIRITVGEADVPWTVNMLGHIHRYNGVAWERMPGSAKDITASEDGSVYVVGGGAVEGGYGVYKWNGTGWTRMVGAGVRIAVAANNQLWMVDNVGKISYLNNGGRHWSEVPGLATDVFAGPEGTVYMIDRTPVYGGYSMYRWNGVDWSKMSGTGIAMAVNQFGHPWAVNSLGNIWYQNL